MISAESCESQYRTRFTNGDHTAYSDNTSDKGGQGAGFRPHELLEAALASCMNMWLRMYADSHGLPLEGVVTTVWLNRDAPLEPVFEYSVELTGQLASGQRDRLLAISCTCPVSRTLAADLRFSPRD